ncbi:SH3 domain-containing protein [Ningiella sp. W23]|uniref:SH3 domain-containing protein n=1 Tax=Ningiella sp. W23 TaxID=3023715 RepID=UPI0037577DC2
MFSHVLSAKLILALCLYGVSSPLVASQPFELIVNGAFINVHTGPAQAYPIFHVVEKGERLAVLKSQTSWYKIRVQTRGGRAVEGWISEKSIALTRLSDGSSVFASSGSFEDYQNRDFEITLMGGVLDDVAALSASGTWVWTRNLAVDASFTQALGDFSENRIWSLRMRHTLFPSWKISPYLAVGAGQIRTQPRANLVQSGDELRTSNHYEVGAGARYYFTKSVLLKFEYRALLALTDRDEQERLDQWMLGASVFF